MFHFLTFNDIDVGEQFFNSLRLDYPGFDEWFERKGNHPLWVAFIDDMIAAVLYLKDERPAMKLGLLKVAEDYRGRGLGVKALEIAEMTARLHVSETLYATVLPSHEDVIDMLVRHGFHLEGCQTGPQYDEFVYRKVLL